MTCCSILRWFKVRSLATKSTNLPTHLVSHQSCAMKRYIASSPSPIPPRTDHDEPAIIRSLTSTITISFAKPSPTSSGSGWYKPTHKGAFLPPSLEAKIFLLGKLALFSFRHEDSSYCLPFLAYRLTITISIDCLKHTSIGLDSRVERGL
jgi:hypothetical protein